MFLHAFATSEKIKAIHPSPFLARRPLGITTSGMTVLHLLSLGYFFVLLHSGLAYPCQHLLGEIRVAHVPCYSGNERSVAARMVFGGLHLLDCPRVETTHLSTQSTNV